MRNQKIEIRDIRNEDWYWISKKILDEYAFKIGVIGLALYNAYVFYAKYSVLPLEEEVARRLGTSISTPRKYRKILEENEVLKVGRKIQKSFT